VPGAPIALGAQAISLATDVSDHTQVKRLVDKAVETYGRVDVIINNAGLMPLAPLERLKVDEWDRMIDVNQGRALRHCRRPAPYAAAEVGAHRQCLVGGGPQGPFGGAVYAATKHAVPALSEGLPQEVKPYNIRTTVISPGVVVSELPNTASDPDISANLHRMYEQLGIPAESFARAVAFAIGQPEDVDINEILFRPTRQEF
jgi:NADP-dependent 3-hydroxy acid dehydrogenase YdfG